MKIAGKEYELLEVYPDKVNEQKDLMVFETKFGYKECFHRYDLLHEPKKKRTEVYKNWTDSDSRIIKDFLKEGMTPQEISRYDLFNGRSAQAVLEYAKKIKRRMEKANDKNRDTNETSKLE